MANTKQVKGAEILNSAFSTTQLGGDGVPLCSTTHPTVSGVNLVNTFTTQADLSETSLEDALIKIAAYIDERGLRIALQGRKLIIPKELQITAERNLKYPLIVSTAENERKRLKKMNMHQEG